MDEDYYLELIRELVDANDIIEEAIRALGRK